MAEDTPGTVVKAPAPKVTPDAKAIAAANKAKEKEALAKAKEKEKEALAKAKEKEKAAAAKAKADAAKAAEKAKAKIIADKAKADTKAAKEKEKAAKKAEKEAAKNKPPVWVEQVNEHNVIEKVDQNKFPFEITCSVEGCANPTRYVTQSGLLTVTMCKYHAVLARRKRRVASRKDRGKLYAAVVKEALEKGMFPESFKKKHGLV